MLQTYISPVSSQRDQKGDQTNYGPCERNPFATYFGAGHHRQQNALLPCRIRPSSLKRFAAKTAAIRSAIGVHLRTGPEAIASTHVIWRKASDSTAPPSPRTNRLPSAWPASTIISPSSSSASVMFVPENRSMSAAAAKVAAAVSAPSYPPPKYTCTCAGALRVETARELAC